MYVLVLKSHLLVVFFNSDGSLFPLCHSVYEVQLVLHPGHNILGLKPGPRWGQEQICGRIKPVSGIPTLHTNIGRTNYLMMELRGCHCLK